MREQERFLEESLIGSERKQFLCSFILRIWPVRKVKSASKRTNMQYIEPIKDKTKELLKRLANDNLQYFFSENPKYITGIEY